MTISLHIPTLYGIHESNFDLLLDIEKFGIFHMSYNKPFHTGCIDSSLMRALASDQLYHSGHHVSGAGSVVFFHEGSGSILLCLDGFPRTLVGVRLFACIRAPAISQVNTSSDFSYFNG